MMTLRRTMLQAAFCATLIGSARPLRAAGRVIVIFFSRTGTVRELARTVAALTGAELLELKLVQPYAEDYGDMTDIAREERLSGARREIATRVPDLSGYDTVFVGTPYWWGGISIPMRTFLTDHPMSGKTLVPFVVSGSSPAQGAWEDIRRSCPKANVLRGFHVTQSRASSAGDALKAWLQELKLVA